MFIQLQFTDEARRRIVQEELLEQREITLEDMVEFLTIRSPEPYQIQNFKDSKEHYRFLDQALEYFSSKEEYENF